jgi:PAS domain S-box-containing protein
VIEPQGDTGILAWLQRPFYRLRTRLQLAAVVVVLVPMAIAIWNTEQSLRRHVAEDVRESLGVDLEIAALTLANRYEKLRTVVRTVSLDTTVKTTLRLDFIPQLEKHINSLAQLHSLDALAVVDARGRLIAVLGAANIPDPVLRDHPFVAAALAGKEAGGNILEQNPTALAVVERAGSAIDARPVFMQATAQPIIVRNQVIGAVFGALLITDNSKLVDSMRSASGADDVVVVAGNRISVSTCALAGSKQTGQRRFNGGLNYDKDPEMFPAQLLPCAHGGSDNMYAYRWLMGGNGEPVGAIICLRNALESMAILSEIRQQLMLVFLVSAVVALLLLFFLARKISLPIQRLSRAINAFEGGELSRQVEVSGRDEISDLARGFNSMAATIHGRVEELDREIENRLQAEARLAAETERLAVTLRSIGDGFIATDVNGRVVLMNRVIETLTGIDQQQGVGLPVDEICSLHDPVNHINISCPVMSVLAGEEVPGTLPDAILYGVNGRKFVITLAVSPLLDNQQKLLGAIVIIRDVTVQRKNEEEIMQARKLKSVGQLAGGLAHDFNNLLTGILGNISLAQLVSDPGSSHYRYLADAEKASLQARDLIRQLLIFAKGGTPRLEVIDPGDLLIESTRLMLTGSRVEPVFKISPDLWPVEADRGQLNQVMNNLVVNGIHAMSTGGILLVQADNVIIDQQSSVQLAAGSYVRIQVRDNGVGIAPDRLERIFEPYYTTREQGNGLGLAITYSIIHKHQGAITVSSVLGGGTTFIIHLPAVPAGTIPAAEPAVEPAGAARSSLRILLMDDEETVCTVAAEMITTLGHEIVISRDGRSAIDQYEKAFNAGSPFDLVIMDLTIPCGMGGEEAIDHLIRIDPQVVAVVSSGYSDNPIMANPERYGFKGVMAKPYRMAELEQVLIGVQEKLSCPGQ